MDGVVKLFGSAVNPVNATLPSVVGSIREYRNWLAHGKRGPMPPAVAPLSTYQSLTQFLQACGLA
jgi:hypothetical protein